MNFEPKAETQELFAAQLNEKIQDFIASGNKIELLQSFPEQKPAPPRNTRIDPNTILKRKQNKKSAHNLR